MKALTDMKVGEVAMVAQILGGHGAHRRLESLGLRVGKKIRKVSSLLMRGPVVVEIGKSRVAVGYGIAGKVMVEVQKE